MKAVENLLREKIGLDAASIGSSSVERTVRLRMQSLKLKNVEEYLRRLETSRDEWEELVESVVVAETWFFRDREPFATFVQMVRLEWLPQHPSSALRVLSVPCSSGEEPYSLAMALLDADIPPGRFTIDGADLSGRALARARHAIYGANSFRGKELEFRERHFQATKDGHALDSRVRNCVQFHRANVFNNNFLADRPAYDFIFCRNLLIYFDTKMQAKALETLDRLLTPQGVLFVGPAEMPLVTGHGFISANIPMTFACRKAGMSIQPSPGRITRSFRTLKPVAWSPHPTANSFLTDNQTQQPVGEQATSQPPDDLAVARQLADAGNLTEAAMICQSQLERQGPSAQAFYLLGLIHDADGDPEALDYYRKALYLEPNHYESLLQMSLLLEKSGDEAGARTFKRRAERLQQKR